MFCSVIEWGFNEPGPPPNNPTEWFGILLEKMTLLLPICCSVNSGVSVKLILQAPLDWSKTWSETQSEESIVDRSVSSLQAIIKKTKIIVSFCNRFNYFFCCFLIVHRYFYLVWTSIYKKTPVKGFRVILIVFYNSVYTLLDHHHIQLGSYSSRLVDPPPP